MDAWVFDFHQFLFLLALSVLHLLVLCLLVCLLSFQYITVNIPLKHNVAKKLIRIFIPHFSLLALYHHSTHLLQNNVQYSANDVLFENLFVFIFIEYLSIRPSAPSLPTVHKLVLSCMFSAPKVVALKSESPQNLFFTLPSPWSEIFGSRPLSQITCGI